MEAVLDKCFDFLSPAFHLSDKSGDSTSPERVHAKCPSIQTLRPRCLDSANLLPPTIPRRGAPFPTLTSWFLLLLKPKYLFSAPHFLLPVEILFFPQSPGETPSPQ